MNVLVINCGSSSLKFQLINSESEKVLAKGLCERIGIDGSLTYQPAGGEKVKSDKAMPTHTEAIQFVIDALTDAETGVVKSLACQKLMPGTPMVAVFDTAFHQTMPEKAYMYGLPYEYYDKYKVRRYGFHGTSHSFVSKRAAELAGKSYDDLKTVVCHLGNGASICAVENGKSVDTSMGLTPLEGLVMGTRSGDIDPAILEFVAKKEGLDISELMTMLNKKSGVYGLSNNLSSDFRDLENAANEGNAQAKVALEVFAYRVAKYVGSYVAAMNGVDVIAFTAGIGENSGTVRSAVLKYLGYLGITVDEKANDTHGEEITISTPDSKVLVMVIPTNEELAIARETVALV